MVDKLILKQILQNSREEIEQYKIIHRDIQTDGFNCYIFVGVRRAGKSFILYEKIQQMLSEGHTWDEILYLNFEDERLGSLDINDMDSILECHMEMGGVAKPALFLDEIQNIDGWEKFARRVSDSKYMVWITGSNAKMLSKEMMSTLGGRYLPIEIYPFSFAEYLHWADIPWQYLHQEQNKQSQPPASANKEDCRRRQNHRIKAYFWLILQPPCWKWMVGLEAKLHTVQQTKK